MRKIIISILFLLYLQTILAGEIKIEGIYQGENLFVMNPFASTGVGFCVYEVTVNGQIAIDEINSSAFEIDLTVYKLQAGDKLVVIIKHKTDCHPKILNAEVLKPKSTYKVVSIKVDRKDMKLKWTTTGEKGRLSFIVEQFRWNKWKRVGKRYGRGTKVPNTYSLAVRTHTGSNKFRIKQVDYSLKPRYSPEVIFRNLSMPITYSPTKPRKEIKFSDNTDYEIYNYYGRLVKKGYGKIINISKYKKGQYFVNYDNKMLEFTKK